MLKLNVPNLSKLASKLTAPFNESINKSNQNTETLLDISENIINNISESDITEEEKLQQYSEYFEKDCKIVKEQQNHDITIISMIIAVISLASSTIIAYVSRKSEEIVDDNNLDDLVEENDCDEGDDYDEWEISWCWLVLWPM